jgi:hypothetical protein
MIAPAAVRCWYQVHYAWACLSVPVTDIPPIAFEADDARRYGFHFVAVNKRIEGVQLPYDIVHDKVRARRAAHFVTIRADPRGQCRYRRRRTPGGNLTAGAVRSSEKQITPARRPICLASCLTFRRRPVGWFYSLRSIKSLLFLLLLWKQYVMILA